MSLPIDSLASSALVDAIEANMCEELGIFGRHQPGARFHDDGDLVWWVTGVHDAQFNAVWLTRLHPEQVEARIDQTLARFDPGLPMSWTVSPATRPANLGDLLATHGFSFFLEHSAMLTDLNKSRLGRPRPSGLSIDVVHDTRTFRSWLDACGKGYQTLPETAALYLDVYAALGYGEHSPWRHFVGILDGEPVAASSLLLHAGIAGVYGVATAPELRKRGLAAAMILAALDDARNRGYRVALSVPTFNGAGPHRRMGFVEHCTVGVYVRPGQIGGTPRQERDQTAGRVPTTPCTGNGEGVVLDFGAGSCAVTILPKIAAMPASCTGASDWR
jgi:GNAT superfamily N-acetyltransferase